jgi:hypothetical protein
MNLIAITLLPESDSLTLSLLGLFTLISILTLAVWRAANFVRDVREELKGMREDIRRAWTRQEHAEWARRLDRDNRHIPLEVPPVPSSEP